MYSTPVLQVARRSAARDITESRLLKYDIICGCVGPLGGTMPIVKGERDGGCVMGNWKSEVYSVRICGFISSSSRLHRAIFNMYASGSVARSLSEKKNKLF